MITKQNVTYNTLQYKIRNSLIKLTCLLIITLSTLQNGTLITLHEHYKVNLETVLVGKKDKILGSDLVCLFQLASQKKKASRGNL